MAPRQFLGALLRADTNLGMTLHLDRSGAEGMRAVFGALPTATP